MDEKQENPWEGLKIAAETLGKTATAAGQAMLDAFALPSAQLAHAFGYKLIVSEHIAENQAMILEGRIVVGTKVAFVLDHPELKGWELSEAWIAHKIHGSYVRALRRHENRCDRLEAKAEERERARRYSAFDVPIPQEFVSDYLGAWIGNRQQTPDATY